MQQVIEVVPVKHTRTKETHNKRFSTVSVQVVHLFLIGMDVMNLQIRLYNKALRVLFFLSELYLITFTWCLA